MGGLFALCGFSRYNPDIMNYRHIYHAGNFADVFKHIVLILTADYLRKKDKPFFALDTHAGLGKYDLYSEQALKTGEAAQGVARLYGTDHKKLPPLIRRYFSFFPRYNRDRDLRTYPGSPLILRDTLREQDRLVANELHPDDYKALRNTLGGDDRIRVIQEDAYQTLKAMLPPPERRGLVLIDPPFEARNEFETMVTGLEEAHRRWATGIYLLWYPIKDRAAVDTFHQAVKDLAIPDCKALDFILNEPKEEGGLFGCGLLTVNAPWTLTDDLNAVMPWLIENLTQGQGRFEVTVLTGE